MVTAALSSMLLPLMLAKMAGAVPRSLARTHGTLEEMSPAVTAPGRCLPHGRISTPVWWRYSPMPAIMAPYTLRLLHTLRSQTVWKIGSGFRNALGSFF